MACLDAKTGAQVADMAHDDGHGQPHLVHAPLRVVPARAVAEVRHRRGVGGRRCGTEAGGCRCRSRGGRGGGCRCRGGSDGVVCGGCRWALRTRGRQRRHCEGRRPSSRPTSTCVKKDVRRRRYIYQKVGPVAAPGCRLVLVQRLRRALHQINFYTCFCGVLFVTKAEARRRFHLVAKTKAAAASVVERKQRWSGRLGRRWGCQRRRCASWRSRRGESATSRSR